jgi:ketosteroid isomerase-like protein
MTRSEENARVVGRMLRRSMIEGDIDAALTAYAPGFTYHNPVLKALPPTQDARDAMRQLIAQTRDAFPNLDYAVEAMVADDDKVAVLYSWSAVDRHGFAGRPPSGRTVTATGAIFCRLADGKSSSSGTSTIGSTSPSSWDYFRRSRRPTAATTAHFSGQTDQGSEEQT